MANETLRLRIEGMTCDRCAQTIRRSLLRERSVKEARIDWRSGTGRIVVDPDATDAEQVLESPVFHQPSGLHCSTARLAEPERRC